MLALVQGVILEGAGDIRVGYYPSKLHIITVPPRMRVGKLPSHNMSTAALCNTHLQQKTYGNCKNMFLFNIIDGLTLK